MAPRREPKDFSLSEIKREIHRGEQIRRLYHLAKRLLPELTVSNESIKYYASSAEGVLCKAQHRTALVTYYSVFRLKQLNEKVVNVYLRGRRCAEGAIAPRLCFVYHRYP